MPTNVASPQHEALRAATCPPAAGHRAMRQPKNSAKAWIVAALKHELISGNSDLLWRLMRRSVNTPPAVCRFSHRHHFRNSAHKSLNAASRSEAGS
eukprot:11732813-Alexandrium_andersonii.AAC.1